MRIDVYFHSEEGTELLSNIQQIRRGIKKLMSQLDDLTQAQSDEAASISALKTAVEDFIANHPAGPDLAAAIAEAQKEKADIDAVTGEVTEPAA